MLFKKEIPGIKGVIIITGLIMAITMTACGASSDVSNGSKTSSAASQSGTSISSGSQETETDDFYTGNYREQAKVKLEGLSPDWVKSLVITQIRIETISKEGTFLGAIPALDYLQDLGTSAVWISPVFKKNIDEDNINKTKAEQNGFDVLEPDQIEPSLGTEEDLKKLVEEAHKRNIRVFLDIVPHGVNMNSSLVSQHPDWFRKDTDGSLKPTWGKMHDFLFQKTAVEEYWINNCVNLVKRFNIDGFRCDLEPGCFGSMTWAKIRQKCWDEGYKIAIFAECASERGAGFDFDQNGIYPYNLDDQTKRIKYKADFLLKNNIVDVVQTGLGEGTFQQQKSGNAGQDRFYSYALSQHDMVLTVKGSRLRFGYQAIFGPYLPVFFIGEEMNYDTIHGLMYAEQIDLSKAELPEKKAFRDDIKKMISIRREYHDIFEYFPVNHREVNIVKVASTGLTVQAYARYRNNRAVVIAGNKETVEKTAQLNLDPVSMELKESAEYVITDLMTGKQVLKGTLEQIKTLSVKIDADSLRVLLVEPVSTTK